MPRTRRSPLPLALTLVTVFVPCPAALAGECPPVRSIGSIVGEAGWRLGTALAGPGDLDGDGVPDLAIGAPGLGAAGAVLVYSGASRLEIRRYVGEPGAPIGGVVAAVGDIDNDGVGDLLVGAPEAGVFPQLRRGLVRVYSGRNGELLREHFGRIDNGQFGFSAAAAGDLDRDGWADYAVGRPRAEASVFVYSGQTGLPIQTITAFAGSQSDLGYSMTPFGDVNGDGIADLLIGAPRMTLGSRTLAGVVMVFRGLGASQSLVSVGGQDRFHQLGEAVSGLGDIDGDGFPDFAVGGGGGASPPLRVHSGRDGRLLREQLGAMGTGFASRLASAGDVNGDGRAELLIGVPRTSGRFELRSEPAGTLLYMEEGFDAEELGDALAGIGDIDRDGWDDFAVAAPLGDVAGAVDAGIVRLYGMPAPDLGASLVASRVACRGTGVPLSLSLTNPGNFDIEVGIVSPGPTGFDTVVPAGGSVDVELPGTLPACATDGEGTFELRLRASYPGCDGVLDVLVNRPVLCEECELPNCPERSSWWEVASRRRGADAPLQPEEWDELAGCIDELSAAIDVGGSGERLRDLLRVRSNERTAAREAEAEFAALLANHCAGRLAGHPIDPIRLHRATAIDHPATECADLDCRFANLDERLLQLRIEGAADSDPRYRTIENAALEINFGRSIGAVCGPSEAPSDPPVSATRADFRLRANPIGVDRPLELHAADLPSGRVVVELFSIDGRRLRTLLEVEHPGGDLEVTAPAADPAGNRLPASVYFVKLTVGDVVRTTRILLID